VRSFEGKVANSAIGRRLPPDTLLPGWRNVARVAYASIVLSRSQVDLRSYCLIFAMDGEDVAEALEEHELTVSHSTSLFPPLRIAR
jgi:hypothetical protein